MTTLQQNTSTHVTDNTNEWRHRYTLVKEPILDYLLVGWFCKSLLPPIMKDVSLSEVFIEYQLIRHDQHLDFISSPSITLYEHIPNYPHTYNTLVTQELGPHANDLISATSGTIVK